MIQDSRLSTGLATLDGQIRQNLTPTLRHGSRLAASRPTLRRFKYSFYLRYRTEHPRGTSPALLVKIQRLPEHRTLAEAIAHRQALRYKSDHEYEVLQHLWSLFGDQASSDHTAIRPLALLEPWGAIVTEELEAVPLRYLLERRPRRNRESDGSVFHRVGSWLRRYHDASDPQLQSFDVDQLENELVTFLHAIGGGTDSSGLQSFASETAMITRLLEAARGAVTPVAHLHNDFHAENVLVTAQNRVAVLDVWPKPPASVYLDVAMILTQLDLIKIHQLTGGLLLVAQRTLALRQEMLASYFESRPPCDALLALLCARNVAAKWCENEQALRRASGFRRTLRWSTIVTRRAYFRALLRRWLEDGLAALASRSSNLRA